MEKKPTTPAAKKPAAEKKQSNGISPALVIPILFVIGFSIWYFLLGDAANFEDAEKHKPANAMGIVYSGGVIVPILITCMLTVFVFSIERFITIGKASGSGDLDAFVRNVRKMLETNNIGDAIKACDAQKGSVGNVTKTALTKYSQLISDTELTKEQKLASLQKEVEESTSLELPMLEKNLTVLSTLASVATLIALLGTVIGMIKAFASLGNSGGSTDSSALANGISEALINTALGIGTSAICIIAYNVFTAKIDELTYSIDEIGLSVNQNYATHHN